MKSEVVFGNEKIKKAFDKLKHSKTEDRQLYNWIVNALENLEKDAFCGKQIPKRLIPKEYQKIAPLENLWKLNLPNAWRLIYTVKTNQVVVLSIILDWMKHKQYIHRFNYK